MPEVFLGAFLSVAVFATGMLFYSSGSPSPPQTRIEHRSTNQNGTNESKPSGFWEKATDDPVAYFTLWLVVFTAGLGIVTARGIYIQARDTRVLQRAYVAVEPRGIELRMDGGTLMGHVVVKNSGNLPAANLSLLIRMKWCHKGDEQDFVLGTGKGEIVISPHSETILGSDEFVGLQELLDASGAQANGPRGNEKPVYLYIWGAVYYHDGFVSGRITKFSHRYNWKMRSLSPGAYEIDASRGRLHEFGNSTT
jgi:hypothetical protein